ncbi:hypothetical protein GDO86_014256 [Hymenochirus boettgeri]|uniref:Uncharacterized protein n=1 Tax=Hymenochirus boettgeri TaxID=247094 RepID=A0A8T2JTA7_9PIPI|nr:hypothetical protein GDO86_014256 [Hymenochirus boettgeri]
MIQAWEEVTEGSLVYVRDQGSAFFRTSVGWSRILLEDSDLVFFADDPRVPEEEESQNTNRDVQVPRSISTRIPSLRLVALNVPLSGDMSGIRGADLQCYRQALEMSLYGTFRAVLSSSSQSLSTIVKKTDHNLPIVNMRGDLLLKNWNSLLDNKLDSKNTVPILSFNGRNILTDPLWPLKAFWHGTSQRGNPIRNRNCREWRSSSKLEGIGSAVTERWLLDNDSYSCTQPLAVLCIEVAFSYLYMW